MHLLTASETLRLFRAVEIPQGTRRMGHRSTGSFRWPSKTRADSRDGHLAILLQHISAVGARQLFEG